MSDNFLTLPISDILIENRYRKEFGDIETLANNINEHGLIVVITVKKDPETGNYILVDGQRRILAAQRLGWTEIDCYLIDLKEIVFGEYSANTFRKDFVPSEAVRIKKAIEPYEKQKAKERQFNANPSGIKLENNPSGNLPQGCRTRDIIAKRVGIGERTLQKAEKIVEAADKNQKYQKYVDEMDAGKKVGRVYRKYIHDVKTEEHLKSTPYISLPENCDLRLGDFKEIIKDIPSNSIDLIITDPPYADTPENLLRYENLAKGAFRILKLGGVIVFLTGHIILDKVIVKFHNSGLKYWYPMVIKHGGHTQIIHARNMIADCKPILCYVKGEKINEMVMSGSPIHDFIQSSPPYKILHPWEQSSVEAEYLIKKFTTENSIILDPMMGTATNGVAALKLNRKFIGIDIDKETFETAEANIKVAIGEGKND